MEILLVLYLITGMLVTILGFPLLYRKVKPNPWYGFRTPRTLSDPKIWYAVNQYAAKWLVVAGISFLIVSICLYFFPGISVDVYAIACSLVFSVVMTIGIIQSVRFMRTLE